MTSFKIQKVLSCIYASAFCLLFGVSACSDINSTDDAEKADELSVWTNPINGNSVHLPDDWRHSPDTASEGKTVIGYFLPRFAWIKSEYGHVTLHYEDLSSSDRNFKKFCRRLLELLKPMATSSTEPLYSLDSTTSKANFDVEIKHEKRLKLLRTHVWTTQPGIYYYAIIEMLADDKPFISRAMPIVDRLMASSQNMIDAP